MEVNTLDRNDLSWIVHRLPKKLTDLMMNPDWQNSIYVGGGFIRALITGEKVNDIDLFVKSAKDAELLAYKLCSDKSEVISTDNAYTIKWKTPIQIIHRWTFDKPEDVSNSFDFTVCCAVVYYNGAWNSYCDSRFYIDLASKRLIYRSPVRNEDAGGSLLRVLKYYQRGYRIPLNSLGAVIARLVGAVDMNLITGDKKDQEYQMGKVLTGLLKEVDPNVDPTHEAHLPNTEEYGEAA